MRLIIFCFIRLCVPLHYFGLVFGHLGGLYVCVGDPGNYSSMCCFYVHICGPSQRIPKDGHNKCVIYPLPQSFKNLVAKKKRLVVLFSHWLLHAYGIISISRLDKLGQDLPLLALVPGPALFYLLTARFTEPNRILSEGGNGH